MSATDRVDIAKRREMKKTKSAKKQGRERKEHVKRRNYKTGYEVVVSGNAIKNFYSLVPVPQIIYLLQHCVIAKIS